MFFDRELGIEIKTTLFLEVKLSFIHRPVVHHDLQR